jgi:hypothetical protein
VREANSKKSTPAVRLNRKSTSAAAERVFSLVEAIFGTEQLSLLADQVQAGAMLRYNKPHRGLGNSRVEYVG